MKKKEFIRRMIFTEKMNLRYYLKLYFCKEARISIGRSEKIIIDRKTTKAFNVYITIKERRMEGYVILKKSLNGFILFEPEKDRAIEVTISDQVDKERQGNPIRKRARIKFFVKEDTGEFFKGTFGKYSKKIEKDAWCN